VTTVAPAFIHSRLIWGVLLLVGVVGGMLGGAWVRDSREQERIERLQLDARKLGIELMSLTLQGSLMGATELLGRIDPEIKREVRGELTPNGPHITRMLQAVMRSGDSDGGFVVGGDGIIRSSFGLGKSSTGVDVRFRPYFQAAMTGKQTVYAAIGTTTGRRTLYFAAPVYQGEEQGMPVSGVVVARGGITPVDKLLASRSMTALLLSPQGVVFATNRPDWMGFMADKPTPDRLKELRETKQFGKLFDDKDPVLLPIPLQPGRVLAAGGRHGIATQQVSWNDPLGDWRLALIEDLGAAVPAQGIALVGLTFGLATFILLAILLVAWRSLQAQAQAAHQIEAYAQRQQQAVERKSRQAAAAVRLQQAHTPEDIARTFLNECHALLGALHGVVYVTLADDSQRLRLAACFAGSEQVKEELILGETLLGECALAGESQIIETPPAGIWSINSGLGHAPPAALLLGPIRAQGDLLGVVELAVLNTPDGDLKTLFEEMLELLALNLKLAQRNGENQS
jgi:two-component system C4-dicarboxylate transport sensor histidine kinase DctB